MTQSALAGIKVLDLSSEGPGPFCTMVLADLGADVTVVDRPSFGSTAAEGIPDASTQGLARPHFDAFARNKRRLGLNLKQDGALEVVHRLAADADVVIVQMRPGKPDGLGIGYDQLKALNPRLVYCMITGFGETGPLRNQAGHDLNYLGISGVLSLFARRAVPPPAPPYIIADFGAGGMVAATAILAALQARHVTGEGQHIDISMTDACTYLCADWMSMTFDPQGDPTMLADYPPYDVYTCSDGRLITIGCVEPRFWTTLCEAVGHPDLIELASNPDRDSLRGKLQGVFASDTRDAWLERLSKYDVPVGTVNQIEELPDDPQVQAREMVIEVETEHGPVKQVGIGAKLSATPGSVRRAGVPHGADTAELLAEVGFSADRIEELRVGGAVFG